MAYIFAVFFVTMAASGFLMEELFGLLGIIPEVVSGQSATEQEYFSLDYTFWLNLLAVGLSAFLYWTYRTKPKGPYRDPVCGMLVPEDAEPITVDGETYRFCSDRCRRRFERRPERYGSADPSGG